MMRVIVATVMMLILASLLGGCSVGRWGVMREIGKSEVPVMEGAKVTKVEVVPWAYEPEVTVHVECPCGQIETLAWYKEKLVGDGWELSPASEGWTKGNGVANEQVSFFASRKRWKNGDQWLSKEELELVLAGTPEKARVEVRINGDYVWDWFGKGISQGVTAATVPPGYAVLGLVQIIHGGYVLLGILDFPLMVSVDVVMVLF